MNGLEILLRRYNIEVNFILFFDQGDDTNIWMYYSRTELSVFRPLNLQQHL